MDVTNVNPAYLMAVKSSSGGGAFEFSGKAKRKSTVSNRVLRILGSIQVSRYNRDGSIAKKVSFAATAAPVDLRYHP
jgi:hypothetical protein